MVFCGFFKMVTAAIMDFWNFKFSTVGTVKMVELRHRAIFRRNRCDRDRDIVIFRYLKLAAVAIWDFWICGACLSLSLELYF